MVQFDTVENAETAICTLTLNYPPLEFTDLSTAKFTGYQYGGRPLGLTFVKYVNAGAGDAMEGAEATGVIAQDQIM